ncbi:MAG: GntR family transcriptional regulator [Anaerovoracaceae bacterium]|jgi:GntR family transcriptional regulator
MFQLDLKNRKSIYEQIVDNIKELIITGILTADEKIPSVRELSKTLTVNPNTIQKAYRELERQGYLYPAQGLGSFVTSPDKRIPDIRKINELKENIQRQIKELNYLGMSTKEILAYVEEILKEGVTYNDTNI